MPIEQKTDGKYLPISHAVIDQLSGSTTDIPAGVDLSKNSLPPDNASFTIQATREQKISEVNY